MSQRVDSWSSVLTEDDMYYLRENLEVEYDLGPADPQGQRVYAAQSNMIDCLVPAWKTDEVESYVQSFAERHGLKIKLRWRKLEGGVAYVGRGGGTIVLNRGCNSGQWIPVVEGEHILSLVLHELAHVLTPYRLRKSERYDPRELQPHGPEFVRCYIDLLAEHIDTSKVVAAFEYLGVEIGPECEYLPGGRPRCS